MTEKTKNTNVKIEDIASIKKDEMRTKILIIIGAIAIVFAFAIWYQINEKQALAEQDYIGGNFIRLSNNNGTSDGDINVVNPWRNASVVDLTMYRALFSANSSFTEINPDLAEKYELLDDDVTYIITMFDNQFWSDGEPITVDDVIFSFYAFLKCENVNTSLSTTFSRVIGAKEYSSGETDIIEGISVNGNQITIKLEAPYSNFALMLTQFVPLPKHILENTDYATLTTNHEFFTNTNTVCSGQFYPEYIDADNNLVLSRNPYYADDVTDIDKILICWDYENLEIDYYPTSNPTEIVSNRSMKGFIEYPVEVYYYRYFIFNLAGGDTGEPNTAMHDERVRQAIYHAIDTELLMKDIYFNKTTPVYGGSLEFSKPIYDYNPEKAKELLESAGYDFDRVFTIAYYSGDTSTYAMLEKIVEQLESVGVTAELIKASASELYTEPTYDLLLKNLSALNTEDWYNEYLSTNANLTQLMGRAGEFDDLMYKLTSTTDSNEYEKLMQELVNLEQELLYKLPLFLLNDAVFINSNRLSVPDDIVFGNTRYRSDIRLDEWYVMKS
ncbi:MAG: ABC transporter substrate-binding protein [Clostridia bacterium]